MLARTDDEKETLKRQIEDEHPEWRATRSMPMPIENVLRSMVETLPTEDYSHDPWWIMRVEPNSYRTAQESLKRNGFESYSPTFKVIVPMPLRMIPPKKRHQAALFKREVRKQRFEGYAFVRRMFGVYDSNRLHDLDGCGSIVKSAGSIALVMDLEIELMRLVEEDGTQDQVIIETYKGYKVARLPDGQQWVGKSRIVGRLDDSGGTVLFVEHLGRIARLISQADPTG